MNLNSNTEIKYIYATHKKAFSFHCLKSGSLNAVNLFPSFSLFFPLLVCERMCVRASGLLCVPKLSVSAILSAPECDTLSHTCMLLGQLRSDYKRGSFSSANNISLCLLKKARSPHIGDLKNQCKCVSLALFSPLFRTPITQGGRAGPSLKVTETNCSLRWLANR